MAVLPQELTMNPCMHGCRPCRVRQRCGCARGAAPECRLEAFYRNRYTPGDTEKQTAQSAGETSASYSQGLGKTAIVLNALTHRSTDVYPETPAPSPRKS